MLSVALLATPAWAGCTKDTECKGDRVCEQGACVDPQAAAPAVVPPTEVAERPSAAALASAANHEADANAGIAWGWVLGGASVAFGAVAVTGSVAEWYSPTPEILGGLALGSAAFGGPIAAGGGNQARRGLRLLNAPTPGEGLRVTGWILYGSGMAIGAGSVIAGISGAGSEAAVPGAIGLVSGATGIVLLEADAGNARRMLEEARSFYAAAEPERRIVLLPTVAPTRDGGLVGLVGQF